MMVTKEQLLRALRYDPLTGVFTWIARSAPKSHIHIGDVAGGLDRSTGYISIDVHGRKYRAHRLAWHDMTVALILFAVALIDLYLVSRP